MIYTGETYYKIERNPFYVKDGEDCLVKVLLDLKFIKLVKRIKATDYNEMFLTKAVETFHYLSNVPETKIDFNKNIKKSATFGGKDWLSNILDKTMPLYGFNKKGFMIGKIDLMVDVINRYKVDPYVPGILINKETGDYASFSQGNLLEFKKGDMVFNPNWRPKNWNNIKLKDIQSYTAKMEIKVPKTLEEAERLFDIANIPIKGFIPYNRWGDFKIRYPRESRKAAISFLHFIEKK